MSCANWAKKCTVFDVVLTLAWDEVADFLRELIDDLCSPVNHAVVPVLFVGRPQSLQNCKDVLRPVITRFRQWHLVRIRGVVQQHTSFIEINAASLVHLVYNNQEFVVRLEDWLNLAIAVVVPPWHQFEGTQKAGKYFGSAWAFVVRSECLWRCRMHLPQALAQHEMQHPAVGSALQRTLQ